MPVTPADLDAIPDWTVLDAAARRYRRLALRPGEHNDTERNLQYWAAVTKNRHDVDEQTIENAANALLDECNASCTEQVQDARAVARTLHRLGYLRPPAVDAEVDEAPDPDALDTSPTDDPGTWEPNQ